MKVWDYSCGITKTLHLSLIRGSFLFWWCQEFIILNSYKNRHSLKITALVNLYTKIGCQVKGLIFISSPQAVSALGFFYFMNTTTYNFCPDRYRLCILYWFLLSIGAILSDSSTIWGPGLNVLLRIILLANQIRNLESFEYYCKDLVIGN